MEDSRSTCRCWIGRRWCSAATSPSSSATGRAGASDQKKRRAIVERIQAVFYEDVGRSGPFLHFWDTWLAK